MSNLFDNLVREGNYTGAIRLFARTQYESGKMGHTRMQVMVRVADENDELKGREEFYNKVCDEHYAEVAKLQAEIERLKQMVKSITGGLDVAIESAEYLAKELDKYKLAYKYACKALDDTELNWFTPGGNSMEFTFLRKAERELENG